MKVMLVNENYKQDCFNNLLHSRGVTDIDEFLNPTEACLSDPALFDNIVEARRILNYVLTYKDSKILIVVDADVDGYTSGAIMYNYIKAINPMQYIDYILHEHKQHGLEDHYKAILEGDIHYDLIILPDSSSNDYIYHEALGKTGTTCLVLDHHEIDKDQKISDYACIVNNQLSPNYPNKDLTGAGVAWQFCRYHEQFQIMRSHYADELIDLAALGICGDMGSVLSLENRYIMKKGFENINNYFFQKAIDKQSYSMGDKINATTVAFYIVPMMNAMIRVGTMEEKDRLFRALINGHEMVECKKRGAAGTMEEVAVESLRECINAKAKQTRITDQMVEKLEQKIFKYDLLENKILFVRLDDDDDFPSEINGLIAMKLCAKYKRPTIVARLNDEGYDRGSIRNDNNCELGDFKAFLNNSGYFEYAQGHANAAGCSIKDKLLRAFHEYANSALANINFNEEVYDVNFIMDCYDPGFERMIFELGEHPDAWGQNNSEPLIYIPNIYLIFEDVNIMGAKKDTIRIYKNGVSFIKFHATDMIEELRKTGEIKLDVVGRANINEWMGNQSAQVFIESYEISNSLLEF